MSSLAYLDPGSGSMLLQALLGGLASAAVALRIFGTRIFGFLRLRRATTEEPPADQSEADSS